ncbi:MAG: GTP-dependent dephospho-CoA kinase family protein [Halohasta sp.]
MLRLPDSLRGAFKEPFGPVYTDPDELLAAVDDTGASDDTPLVAVGDMVTYHLLEAGRRPDVAVIDGKTERTAVAEAVGDVLADPDGRIRRVDNPPATISHGLLVALTAAIDADEPVTIVVDGEEDLATLPAIVAAPRGSSVVYGQPGEGMVHVAVSDSLTAEARELLRQFDGDIEAALAVVDA